ncbi:N-acetyltransferase family protein [Longispora urticae]
MTVLIADATPMPVSGHGIRRACVEDYEPLGRLYFSAYDPGVSWSTVEESIHDIRSSFHGQYGALWHGACLRVDHDGQPVAAVYTVHRAPWPDTPDCPFVIDLHVAPAHRRTGLAHRLLATVLTLAAHTDRPQVALRVDPTNTPALRLYTALGFRRLDPTGHEAR